MQSFLQINELFLNYLAIVGKKGVKPKLKFSLTGIVSPNNGALVIFEILHGEK
jgi:hypothetical protein